MSDQEPPGGPPPPPPPEPYGAPGSRLHQPPRKSGSGTIWLGVGLAIPAMIAVGVVAGIAGAIDSSGTLSGMVVLAGLVAPLVMLFFDRTRRVAIGLLIGGAVVFILFAGACVALLAAYD
jgi:hypothetical protein